MHIKGIEGAFTNKKFLHIGRERSLSLLASGKFVHFNFPTLLCMFYQMSPFYSFTLNSCRLSVGKRCGDDWQQCKVFLNLLSLTGSRGKCQKHSNVLDCSLPILFPTPGSRWAVSSRPVFRPVRKELSPWRESPKRSRSGSGEAGVVLRLS